MPATAWGIDGVRGSAAISSGGISQGGRRFLSYVILQRKDGAYCTNRCSFESAAYVLLVKKPVPQMQDIWLRFTATGMQSASISDCHQRSARLPARQHQRK